MIFKICGLKKKESLICCEENKVDFFGMIFYERSPRNIKIDEAKILINISKKFKIKPVGVFVDHNINDLKDIIKTLNLKFVQLHGNENQDDINEIKEYFKKDIYKSISPKNFQNTDLKNVTRFLIEGDPSINDQPGGNNKTWNWNDFINPKKLPFILSGGLNQDNLSQAIDLTGANFVDINSGVEEIKGEKNLSLIDSLISSLKNE